MKKRKAQITIFIIIAVIIIVLVALFFFFQNSNKKSPINPNVQPIHSFIQSCIDQTTQQAVYYISERGGYYNLPENTMDELTPYYLLNEENLMPSKNEIQNQISTYINENLIYCINNFIDFSDFEITQQEIKTTTNIKDNNVLFNINYPISILKQDKTYTFDKFNSEVKIRLGIVYDSIEKIMQEQMKDTTGFNPNNIYEVSVENDLNINMNGFINDSVIFVVLDKNSKINNKDFIFIFANKYIPSSPI